MRLLLDTHILIAILRGELQDRYPPIDRLLLSSNAELWASTASLWEIAIKTRLGKLDPVVPLDRLASVLEDFGIALLSIDPRHAVGSIDPEPPTRDPFDRMLLAQCRAEKLRLVTFDRALLPHPLAFEAGNDEGRTFPPA